MESKYRPYTLRDYKKKFGKSPEKNKSFLGGLGANQDSKWEEAMQSFMRMRVFSSAVKEKHTQNFK